MDDEKQNPRVTERLRDVLAKRNGSDREALARRSAVLTETVVAQARVIEVLTIEEAKTSAYASDLMDIAAKLAETNDRMTAHVGSLVLEVDKERRTNSDLRELYTRATSELRNAAPLAARHTKRIVFLQRTIAALLGERCGSGYDDVARKVLGSALDRASDHGDTCGGYNELVTGLLAEIPE